MFFIILLLFYVNKMYLCTAYQSSSSIYITYCLNFININHVLKKVFYEKETDDVSGVLSV